jgi:hypothetical protein
LPFDEAKHWLWQASEYEKKLTECESKLALSLELLREMRSNLLDVDPFNESVKRLDGSGLLGGQK